MNVGIIGASAARLFAEAGHEIAVSNYSLGLAPPATLVADIGPRARAASIEEAASFSEVVLAAIPFFAYETFPAEPFAGIDREGTG